MVVKLCLIHMIEYYTAGFYLKISQRYVNIFKKMQIWCRGYLVLYALTYFLNHCRSNIISICKGESTGCLGERAGKEHLFLHYLLVQQIKLPIVAGEGKKSVMCICKHIFLNLWLDTVNARIFLLFYGIYSKKAPFLLHKVYDSLQYKMNNKAPLFWSLVVIL